MESASVPLQRAQFNKYALTIDETAAKLPRNQRFFARIGQRPAWNALNLLGPFAQVGKRGPQRISKMVAFQAWPLELVWILSLADIPPKVNGFPPRMVGRAQQKRRPGVFPAASKERRLALTAWCDRLSQQPPRS